MFVCTISTGFGFKWAIFQTERDGTSFVTCSDTIPAFGIHRVKKKNPHRSGRNKKDFPGKTPQYIQTRTAIHPYACAHFMGCSFQPASDRPGVRERSKLGGCEAPGPVPGSAEAAFGSKVRINDLCPCGKCAMQLVSRLYSETASSRRLFRPCSLVSAVCCESLQPHKISHTHPAYTFNIGNYLK